MRDGPDHPNDAGGRGYPAVRWILVLVLTALIARGGVALLDRGVEDFQDLRRLFLVGLGAAFGMAYLISTLILGTRRVESLLGESPSPGKNARVSWFLVAALVVVVALTIIYTA